MGDQLSALTVVFTEFYYWVTIVMMFLIHVGFCLYEVGVSRRRNHIKTLLKNTMAIPLVTVTFYFFGWWIYFAFPNGPGFTGGMTAAPWATPWSPLMATHLSGANARRRHRCRHGRLLAPAERRVLGRLPALLDHHGLDHFGRHHRAGPLRRILAHCGADRLGHVDPRCLLGLASTRAGWCGCSAITMPMHRAWCMRSPVARRLAVVIVLGPRLGKFRADGTPRDIPPHNTWLVCIGLLMIYTGFWGFYAACNIPIINPAAIAGQITGDTWTATNIYLAPTTLSAITFNFLMSLSGGMMAGYIFSKGDPFWTFSAGLCGIIGASAGNDLYHPIQAMLIGAIVPFIAYKLHY